MNSEEDTGDERLQAFVCEHLVHGDSLGFFVEPDDENPFPDAWCGACDVMLFEGRGEWTDDLSQQANIKLICEDCYLEIRSRSLPPVQ